MKQTKEKLTPKQLKEEIIGSIAMVAILAVAIGGIWFSVPLIEKARINYSDTAISGVEFYAKGNGERGLRVNKVRTAYAFTSRPTSLIQGVLVLYMQDGTALYTESGAILFKGHKEFKMGDNGRFIYAINQNNQTMVLNLELKPLFSEKYYQKVPTIYGERAVITEGESDFLSDLSGKIFLPELSFKAGSGKNLDKEFFSFVLQDGNLIVTDGEKYLSLGKVDVSITVNRTNSRFETGTGRTLRTYPFANMRAPVPPR